MGKWRLVGQQINWNKFNKKQRNEIGKNKKSKNVESMMMKAYKNKTQAELKNEND